MNVYSKISLQYFQAIPGTTLDHTASRAKMQLDQAKQSCPSDCMKS